MPSCCKLCRCPSKNTKDIEGAFDETEPLLIESNKPFDELIDPSLDDNPLDNPLEIDKVQQSKKTILGMVIVAIGTALFCSVGAVVQHHGGSVLQLMLGRYITQNIISWIVWLIWKPAQCTNWYGDSPHKLNIWSRGLLLFLTVFCWWRGLELVPLGDGEAILFLSPITTVIAARLLLSEKLPNTFFLTLIITLTGLVFICQPTFIFGGENGEYIGLSIEGIIFLLGAVVAWSGACVLVRTAKSAHWIQLEITATTQSIFLWCPLIILINRLWLHSDDLSGGDWIFDWNTVIVMFVIGALGFSALMLNVIGYQIGDATKVAWMEYLDLVFAFLYQWLYFKNEPSMWEIIGCCALLSTCFIHLGEEFYHYVQHKKDKIENDNKKHEGISDKIDMNMINAEYLSADNTDTEHEFEPLLESKKPTKNISSKKVQLINLVNKLNVFKSNYSNINNNSNLNL